MHVTDGLISSALREVRRDMARRPVIVGVLALGVLLGISGPFDTFSVLSIVPRMIYWICVVAVTYAIGSLVSTIVHKALKHRSKWFGVGVSILSIGISVTVVLEVINFAAFGLSHETWGQLLRQLGFVTLIAGVVEIGALALQNEAAPGAPADAVQPVPLLDRMAFDKRGEILSLGAEDHYVRVTTTKGAELILMRLSDAVKEVGATQGLQIHRSHWVALDHLRDVTRSGDRGTVTLSDGTTRPISRGYLPAVRGAKLLPQAREPEN